MRVLASALCFLISLPVLACDVIDDMGHTIHLDHPAYRIISLAPDLTELLFAAGAGAQIVGVVSGSDFPLSAKKIPVVANYNSLDEERIFRLHPDLIVTWAAANLSTQLQRLGFLVYVSQQRDVMDIPKTLTRLGCLAGTDGVAKKAANNFSQRYHALQHQYAKQKVVSVFYQIWSHPLMTVSKESWINQMITLCGGKNIFADTFGVAPQINREAVILNNPQVILSSENNQSWKKSWTAWPQLTAVSKGNMFSINPDLIERAGPRLLDGAETVCQFLQKVRSSNNPIFFPLDNTYALDP